MTNQALRMHGEHFSSFNVENIGLIERVLRIGAAAVLIGQILLWRENVAVQSYLVLLGLYPAFTALIGWDLLYALVDGRTCGRSPHSVCGTLTEQVRVAVQGWRRRGAIAKVLPFRSPAAEAPNGAGQDDRDRAA